MQRTNSGGKRGRRRIRITQGSSITEEVSIVAFSKDWLNFVTFIHTEGVKRESAKAKKVSSIGSL